MDESKARLPFRAELAVESDNLFPEQEEENDVGKRHHVKNGFVDACCCRSSSLLIGLRDKPALGTTLGIGRTVKQKDTDEKEREKENGACGRFHGITKVTKGAETPLIPVNNRCCARIPDVESGKGIIGGDHQIHHYSGDRYIQPDGISPVNKLFVFLDIHLKASVKGHENEGQYDCRKYNVTDKYKKIERAKGIVFRENGFLWDQPVVGDVRKEKAGGKDECGDVEFAVGNDVFLTDKIK